MRTRSTARGPPPSPPLSPRSQLQAQSLRCYLDATRACGNSIEESRFLCCAASLALASGNEDEARGTVERIQRLHPSYDPHADVTSSALAHSAQRTPGMQCLIDTRLYLSAKSHPFRNIYPLFR